VSALVERLRAGDWSVFTDAGAPVPESAVA
jgi:hypothetical protein